MDYNLRSPDLLELPPLTFDIETDGLLLTMTKIHCIAIDDQLYDTPDGILFAIRMLMDYTGVIIGHNIIGFDIPAIQKLFPAFKPKGEVIDTKVWAQMVVPDVLGLTLDNYKGWKRSCPPELWSAQSLKAWGYRLGVLKGTTPDSTWATYTPDMGKYCLRDVVVTRALAEELRLWTTSAWALQTEMDVARVIQRQIEFGVCFNKEAAEDLGVRLGDETRKLNLQLQELFPPWQKLEKSFVPEVNNKKFGHVKGQMYHKYVTVEFNPGSNHHLVEKLQERYGWEPTAFTDKGNPQMDERVLDGLAKLFPEVELVVRYRTAKKIATFISGSDGSWLNHLTPEGKIHGNVNSCGAGTRRMTHNSPNLGQVPSSRAYLGKECRGLFGPPPGFVLVGVDADQLELRGLAHFLHPYDGGAYVHAACHGSKDNQTDIHWRNAKAVGIDRDSVKTVFYA